MAALCFNRCEIDTTRVFKGENMYKLLIVEDEQGISEEIKRQAENWGLEVRCAADFRNIMAEFAEFDPQIVLMDIALPFIFISSASDNMNIVMAMNMGADDFIAKPFDGSVLIAKVQAMLRRTYDFGGAMPVLEHKGALLNTGDGCLTYGEEKLELTKNEYRILLCLMKNKGTIVSREKLMEALWATDSFVDENTLSVNVGRLRKKLEAVGLKDFIATKFGAGYIIE